MHFAPLRCLPLGSTIAVVAPAGPADDAAARAVPALLMARGFKARMYPSCEVRDGYLAGSDAQRLTDLHAAIADPLNTAVWCLRGGYGSGRLLQHINGDLVRRHPKPLIGYSDITALHAFWTQHGVLSLHAPMLASDLVLPGRKADSDALFGWLQHGLSQGTVLAPDLPAKALRRRGRARGRLVGGNLSLVAALCGTPWQLRTESCILFLEDVGEPLYRVDRMLLQLHQSGLLQSAAGIVLGSFTEEEDPHDVLRDLLMPMCSALRIPLLSGWPAGHGTPNRPLPMGASVLLDAEAGSLTIQQDVLLA